MFTALILFFVSIFAGTLGAILGLGGGIIIIPLLTLAFHIDIHYAIGASIVSVIATSSGAAAVYIRDQLTNVRLAILLEVATSLGALTGAYIASIIQSRFLFLLFAALLLHSAYLMWRRREGTSKTHASVGHPLAKKLQLNSSYQDPHLKTEVQYLVEKVPQGFFYMYGAGILSALLGIGSGILKVLAMDSTMGLPIKVSSATSNFMIGVTAAASAGAYFMKGQIVPQIATPVAIGVLVGATLGTRVMPSLPNHQIRRGFVVILIIVALEMGYKGLSGS